MAKTKKFGKLMLTALAVAAMVSSQFASAEVISNTVVSFTNGIGDNPGGAFNGSVFSGGGAGLSGNASYGNTFQSFCLEAKEYIYFNSTKLYVKSVTDSTISGISGDTATTPSATGDKISSETAWLFTQFYKGVFGGDATSNTALQQAIWSFENEGMSLNSLASSYKTLASTAVNNSNVWSGIGNVRVLNLYKDANYTQHAQDQLYMISAVPEVETYAMMLAGLGLMGTIVRRRKSKNA